MIWEEIMQKSPTMKTLIENKISEEIAKKQSEIDVLNQKITQQDEIINQLIVDSLGGM